MAIDPYSSCPCGSGKKIKFCKCGIDAHDLERIHKLIEGEQYVAAFDRINALLKKTPNAAWLLAIKAEMALRLGELEVFRETTERFVQLKPTNPLALAMQAISVLATTADKHQVAARCILDSLAESSEEAPSLLAEALALLVSAIARTGHLPLIAPWDALGHRLLGPQWMSRSPMSERLMNLLLKSQSPLHPPPADAPWLDRYQEARVLTQGFRHAQAESKLKALLRDYPGELVPLMLLFDVQRTLLDESGMIATAAKLRDHSGLDEEFRAYYEAIILCSEGEKRFRIAGRALGFELPDPEAAIARLAQDGALQASPDEAIEFRQTIGELMQEEVPPSHAYIMYDRSLKPAAGEEATIASEVGLVLLYGKQVDKPARLYAYVPEYRDYPQRLQSILDDIPLGAELQTGHSLDGFHKSLFTFLDRTRITVTPERKSQVDPEQEGRLLAEEFPDIPLEAFGQRTVADLAKESEHKVTARALSMLLEGAQFIVVPRESIGQAIESIGMQRPAAELPLPRPFVGPVILGLDRVDPATVNDEQLGELIQTASSFGAQRAAWNLAIAIRQRESAWQNPTCRYSAAMVLLARTTTPEEGLELVDLLEATAPAVQDSPGKWAVHRISLLAELGRPNEMQSALMKAIETYPNDPYVMEMMATLMASQRGAAEGGQRGGPSGEKPVTGGPAEQKESKLVLPGQEGERGQQSGSGLWLPGQ